MATSDTGPIPARRIGAGGPAVAPAVARAVAPAVAFDPELAEARAAMPAGGELSAPTLAMARAGLAAMEATPAQAIGDLAITWHEELVPGRSGAPGVTLLILRPAKPSLPARRPAIYSVHGGGMMLGTRFSDLNRLVALVAELGIVAVSPEYRLAPEHPYPAGLEDCYAGLSWLAGHAAELDAAAGRIVVMGGSAGGGLAAGLALLARDRGGPALAGQLLLCPMIEDRNDSRSTLQYATGGMWTRASNALGWQSLLGAGHGDRDDVPEYAAPARGTELAGLPPAFVEVGEAEIFRDEDVAYCARLWQAGVTAELHVWARAYHGFDIFAPGSQVAAAALAARLSWLRRMLGAGHRL